MARNEDPEYREKRRPLRAHFGATSGACSLSIVIALGLATLGGAKASWAASYGLGLGTKSASSAASAAANSRYMQTQQQRRQTAEEEYQRQLYARQQTQMAQQQAQQQARLRQAQLQAQQAQQTQQNAAQGASSSKGFFSGLWNRSDSSDQSRRPLMSAPFQRQPERQESQASPERNNFLGIAPIFKRSNQHKTLERQYENAQMERQYSSAQYAQANRSYAPQGRQAPSPEALAKASTDRNEAREVLAKIPWDSLSSQAQAKLQQLTSSSTLYRRMPMAGGRCNPELFDFFLTYPNAVVELWRSMGYEDITMVDRGNQIYEMREKSGSVGTIQVLYQDAETTIAYCNGYYRGLAFGRPLNGEVALILQTRYTEDANRTPFVVCRLDAFIDVKNPGADILARTFSATVGKLADSNFEQTLAFVDSVSQSVETDPGGFQQTVFNLQGLSPDARKILAVKTERVAEQAQARARGEAPEYQLLAKRNQPVETYARILSRGAGQAPSRAVVKNSSPYARPTATQTPNSVANGLRSTPGLSAPSVARSSSLGRTAEFERTFASNEFALDDSDDSEEFESSLEWDENGASLAKVGARPSTNAEAIELLDEQEQLAEYEYLDAPSSLSTDSDALKDDDFEVADDNEELSDDDGLVAIPGVSGANDDFEVADDNEELSDDDDLIAIPGVSNDKDDVAAALPDDDLIAIPGVSNDENDVAVAEPLDASLKPNEDSEIAIPLAESSEDGLASDSEDATISSDEPIYLDLPSETPTDVDSKIAMPLSDADEGQNVAQTPRVVRAKKPVSNVPSTVLGLKANAKQAPYAQVENNNDLPTITAVEDTEEETKAGSRKVQENEDSESEQDDDWALGWVPVAQTDLQPAKVAEKVAEPVNEVPTIRTAAGSGWRGVSDSTSANDAGLTPSFPSKFVTRRYTRNMEDVSATNEPRTFIPTFDSSADESEESKKTK